MGACTSDVSGCPAENAGGMHPNTIVFGGDGTNEKNILIRFNTFDAQDGVGDEGSPSLRPGRTRAWSATFSVTPPRRTGRPPIASPT